MIWIIFCTIVVLLTIWYTWLRHINFTTSDGAIIMALGIMVNGAFQLSPLLSIWTGPPFTILLIGLLLWMFAMLLRDAAAGEFSTKHLSNPLASFAVCTWVPAISVTAVAIVKVLPALKFAAIGLLVTNLILWIACMFVVLRNYRQLYRHPAYLKQVHGILLLACVATESIVIAGNRVAEAFFPTSISLALILTGIFFYIVGLVFIVLRYVWLHPGKLVSNWQNSNCIIHGAMSITGLAAAVSGVLSANITVVIWLYALAMFITIECIEVTRAILRIRHLGWISGLFTYSSSQWSRNFTFGMFLTCTMYLPLRESFLAQSPVLSSIRSVIIYAGMYVVVSLFIIQAVLFVRHHLKETNFKVPKVTSSQNSTTV